MRLGEILVAAQVITAQQLEDALQAQVMLGARLGTSLVELGYLDLDGVAKALAHQHGIPPALAAHFDRADRTLQRLLAPSLAERFACVPLFRVGKRSAVLASLGPLEPRTLAIIADEMDMGVERLILAVSPELRIRYVLEHVYNVARPQRFLRAPGAPHATRTSHTFEAVDLSALSLEQLPDPSDGSYDSGERRSYVKALEPADDDPLADADSTMEIDPELDLEEIPDNDLATTVDMITAGHDREEVSSLTIAAIRHLIPAADAVVMFTLRGAIAVSAASFRRDSRKALSIALPVDEESCVAAAVRSKALVRRGPAHTEVDQRLLSSVGLDGGHLVVAPLITGARAISAIAIASRTAIDADVVETIASAAAAGFGRLMREANQ